MLESKQGQCSNFSQFKTKLLNCSGPIAPMIELIQILLDINSLPKFGADWSIYADNRV